MRRHPVTVAAVGDAKPLRSLQSARGLGSAQRLRPAPDRADRFPNGERGLEGPVRRKVSAVHRTAIHHDPALDECCRRRSGRAVPERGLAHCGKAQ